MIGPILISFLPLIILVAVNPKVAEKVGPNSFIGFRFPSTMLDEETWLISHQKAWPWVLIPGLLGLFAIAYSWFDFFAAGPKEINMNILLLSVFVVVLGVLAGAIVAVRKARQI